MPHYKGGAEAQIGDVVLGKNWEGKTLVGTVQSISPGSTTCNMMIASMVTRPAVDMTTATIDEFELLHRPVELTLPPTDLP